MNFLGSMGELVTRLFFFIQGNKFFEESASKIKKKLRNIELFEKCVLLTFEFL